MFDIESSDLLNKNFKDNDDNNALQLAAANGHEDTVEFLLSRSFSINHTNRYGWTPLMQAARGGHTATVNMLIKKGAVVMIKNKLGTTALECAVRSGHLSTVKAMSEAMSLAGSESMLTPLMVAAQAGHNSIVRLLLEAGVDVNQAKSGSGLTALMLAALTGQDITARLLVEHGANVMAVSAAGLTALDMAADREKRRVSCFLVQQMSLIKKTESESMEHKLFEAIHRGEAMQVTSILKIDRRIVRCVDKVDGQTPLIRAVIHGHLDIVSLIVNSGADIDQSDNYGFSPLMQAIFCGHNDIALYLMGVGADVCFHQPEKCQFTPFDVATLVGLCASDHPNSDVITTLVEIMGFNSGTKISKTETELRKKWWERMSKKIKKRILTGAESRSTGSTDSQFQPSVIRMPSKDPSPALLRANPQTSYLSSDNMPVVLSPMLPSTGLDTSNSFRCGMPPGIKTKSSNSTDRKRTTPESFSMPYLPTAGKPSESSAALDDKDKCLNDPLARHLRDSSLSQYYHLFRESEVDLEAFSLLTEADLLEMKIYETHPRKRILDSIAKLNKKCTYN